LSPQEAEGDSTIEAEPSMGETPPDFGQGAHDHLFLQKLGLDVVDHGLVHDPYRTTGGHLARPAFTVVRA
jgi:hypothetical protein